MSRAGSGQSGSFALSLAEFAAQATEAIDASLREIIIEVGSSVIRMSPVGNPEIWAQNAVASQYNNAVDDHNSDLRSDPANLTKAGRLKPGRKLNDGMDIVAPEGYVGGRFRANWQHGYNQVQAGQIDARDAGGGDTIAGLQAGIDAADAFGVHYIVNNLPYARRLEYEGWSSQAPAGMVGITTVRFQEFINKAAQELP